MPQTKTPQSIKHPATSEQIANLTDHDLYQRCQEYGLNARHWMRRFAGLLPEVARRGLYKKKGFYSIYEFAKKLAGINEATVTKVLHLSQRIEDKPKLHTMLQNGEAGWSKIEKVSFIATPQNDGQLAEKVKTLNTRALEVYVQQIRDRAHVSDSKNNNETAEPLRTGSAASCEPWESLSFKINPDVERQLRLIKQEFEKERQQPLSWNDVMAEFAKRFFENQTGAAKTKKRVVDVCKKCTQQEANILEEHNITNRYIPAATRTIIKVRSNGMCEFPTCKKPTEIFHHTRRFALRKNHDPTYIVALCTAHERYAHSGFIENEEAQPQEWRTRNEPDRTHPKFNIDQRVAMFRKEPIAELSHGP